MNNILNEDDLKNAVRTVAKNLAEKLPGDYQGKGNEKLSSMFYNCFINTIETTTKLPEGEKPFVITGDIPAMWLRDSSAQVKHYLSYAKENKIIAELIKGLIHRQFDCINADPYSNSYNQAPTGAGAGYKDLVETGPLIWERKYEVDSLCYAISLLYDYYTETGDQSVFTDDVVKGLNTIVDLWILEQNHENSSYRFIRDDCPPSDTLSNEGKGAPVGYTGMTWSGFRPSDDACKYGYLVPANMFASSMLKHVEEFAKDIIGDAILSSKASKLRSEIIDGINQYAIIEHKDLGKIYAYETDGLGNHNLMDDANVPSLLSIPYLKFDFDKEIYNNTRAFVLSDNNPYFYSGKVAKGIGSPHTPPSYIWHIALSMQGLTSTSKEERLSLLETIINTDAGLGFLHEGFHVDDDNEFTRVWFAWSNSIFAEFVCDMMKKGDI